MTTSASPKSTSNLHVNSKDPVLDIQNFSDYTPPTQTTRTKKRGTRGRGKKMSVQARKAKAKAKADAAQAAEADAAQAAEADAETAAEADAAKPLAPVDKLLNLHPGERMEIILKEQSLYITHNFCGSFHKCGVSGRLPVFACKDDTWDYRICLECYSGKFFSEQGISLECYNGGDLSDAEMARLKAIFPEYYQPTKEK